MLTGHELLLDSIFFQGILLLSKAAKVFIDYWLSKNAMQLLATKVGEYVLAPGVFPPIDGISKVKVLPIRSLSDQEIRNWGKEFRKIFYAK